MNQPKLISSLKGNTVAVALGGAASRIEPFAEFCEDDLLAQTAFVVTVALTDEYDAWSDFRGSLWQLDRFNPDGLVALVAACERATYESCALCRDHVCRADAHNWITAALEQFRGGK